MDEIEQIFLGCFSFIVGACLGSFSNVVIYRLPLDLSVVSPGSSCPQCKTRISWYDNVPILSWILLRGKCRRCHHSISFRYPLVEFIMALTYLLLYLEFGATWTLVEYLMLSFGLITVSFIDLDHRIIPDEFSLGGILLGLIGALISPERSIFDSLMGVLLGGGFLWFVAYAYLVLRKEDGMGGGDIKLMAWIGAYLGWMAIPFVVLASSLLGSFVGLAMITRGGSLKSSLPFGPFIVVGAFLYIFFGEDILSWYLGLVIS